jgi:HSP20 family protein
MANKTPTQVPVGRDVNPGEEAESSWPSFATLRQEMDRLFDQFSRGFPFTPSWRRSLELPQPWRFETAFGMAAPAVDVIDKGKTLELTAELPGLDAAGVEVTVSGGVLTIKGEKREEREEKEKNYYLSERRYGSFQRSFQLPEGIDQEKIEATFEKGVLTASVPKSAQAAEEQKKIPIKGA